MPAARKGSLLVFGVGVLIALPLGVAAAPGSHGSLDPSFGQGGIAITPIGSAGVEAHGLVIQRDGKLVVAGLFATGNALSSGFAVVRYLG